MRDKVISPLPGSKEQQDYTETAHRLSVGLPRAYDIEHFISIP